MQPDGVMTGLVTLTDLIPAVSTAALRAVRGEAETANVLIIDHLATAAASRGQHADDLITQTGIVGRQEHEHLEQL